MSPFGFSGPVAAASLVVCSAVAVGGPIVAWRLSKVQRTDGWRYFLARPAGIVLGITGTVMALLLAFVAFLALNPNFADLLGAD